MVTSVAWEGGLAASYRRAFESLGFSAEVFDLEAARARVAPLGRIGHRLMAHLDFMALNAKANRSLVRAVLERQPALAVVVGNEFVRAASIMQIKIGSPATKVINIYPDTSYNMPDYVLAALPLYDLFCTHTLAAIPHLRKLGCLSPLYVPLAADPFWHHPLALTPADVKQFGCELVYVGNWRPEHERLLAALEDFDLAIWGPNYWGKYAGKGSWVRSRWRGRPLLTGVEYAKAHLAAKIALDPIDPLDIPSHNMRLFEVAACGVFALVTRTEEVQSLFQEGKTVICFEDARELVDKVRHYLAHPEECQRIAQRAYDHVVHGGHTYTDRVRAIVRELELG
jgi:spore maturation protein CgeB